MSSYKSYEEDSKLLIDRTVDDMYINIGCRCFSEKIINWIGEDNLRLDFREKIGKLLGMSFQEHLKFFMDKTRSYDSRDFYSDLLGANEKVDKNLWMAMDNIAFDYRKNLYRLYSKTPEYLRTDSKMKTYFYLCPKDITDIISSFLIPSTTKKMGLDRL